VSERQTSAERLSDKVAAQLQALIAGGEIRIGEKLPSERALCDLLGVSRTVVREAVRTLAIKGLVDVRPGGGAVVRAPDSARVAELMTLMVRAGEGPVAFGHILEVRRLIEVEIAGLAAERRDPADLALIEEQLAAMAEHAADARRWAAADVAFHAALAQAAHNPLYPVLLGSIADLLVEVRLTGARLPETPALAYQHHQAIYERVREGDRAGARAAMADHLRESEGTFRRARFSKVSR
jgi:GntR family transcriptional regulator, transcriptional repressor for pyruvate dehydrogenase complex